MKKGIPYFLMILAALLLLVQNHQDVSVGDMIFSSLGLNPWTGGSTGYHLPVIAGLALLVAGIFGTVRLYRAKYPRILSWILLACIGIIYAFPLVTRLIGSL
ncbi:hypothetical protein [Paenibacillus sp. PSB04]|uniref:hypothetical protein n=1 Tax=Paenibacillus sp. PSB04 TaxID=2866810 RepID=UPI0021F109E0|nr:hypothetical protein [Paenibacillus sp. PSB04]UYO04614.1 hypothetical protein K2F33_00830 [Paenibacillus sp. PSB04]